MTQQIDPVALTNATDITCESCGNYTFQPVFLFKRISALLSPDGREGIVPINTFCCVACGWVNKVFQPASGLVAQDYTPQQADPSQLTLDL